ncbi:o-succinylbenzoate--CoA ligase [uncultured Shewanella sp.]|uniref:o-succinylbenzoate--CoA ligase n=1 Tax=uncultured Shewanella sp. TaxID=173975 RepID=UPI002617CDFB|nr:o-succinylbenzoate--CoA ligase [uncultured Shewanella sp.]
MISPLHQTALNTPNAIAIKLTESSANYIGLNQNGAISYSQLSIIVTNLVESIQTQGVGPNSRIACISRNNLEMICLYWACVDLGAIFLPISSRFPTAQITQLCQRFKVDFYWSESSLLKTYSNNNTTELEVKLTTASPVSLELNDIVLSHKPVNPPNIDKHRPLNIILTSGSSGAPKGVVHCLANHIASAVGSAKNIALKENNSWLLSLPLFHIGGLAIVNRCTLAGACVVLSTEQALWQQITTAKISHVSLVAAQLSQILALHPQALDNVEALLLGGGTIEPHLVSALADRHINAYCSYGMSEMSSQITTALINPQGHLGKPLANRQLEIRDGTIWVKGECLFLGYLTSDSSGESSESNKPSSLSKPTDAQGWFNTQDLGELDANGNLKLLGRADNMFICGGENIHPEEIEAALKSHPQIDNAIVFAQEDAKFSLLPAAIIQFTQPEQILSPAIRDSLEQHVLNQIARFKRPRQYYPWPNDVVTTSLKVPRKAIIAAVTK